MQWPIYQFMQICTLVGSFSQMSAISNSTAHESGLNPNDDNGHIVTAVTAWLLAFSTVFVALRCVSRLGIVRRWLWSDTLIVAAWVGNVSLEVYRCSYFIVSVPGLFHIDSSRCAKWFRSSRCIHT